MAPNGGKWWRLKYRFDGKEKRLSLGVYPEISIKAARERRDDARRLLANEIDPSENRKAQRSTRSLNSANRFEVVAREWFEKHYPNWASDHATLIIRRLERDIFTWIGDKPVGGISAPQLLEPLRRIENRGTLETAQHFAAVTNPAKVGELLRVIDGYDGTHTVQCALRLAPLVFVRPGELWQAQWEDFDLAAGARHAVRQRSGRADCSQPCHRFPCLKENKDQ